jgi:hypothetical protein
MIIYYEIFEDELQFVCRDGKLKTIRYTQDTGRVFYRVKFVNGKDEWHPGLYIGRDKLGIDYFLHNNIKTGIAEVVTRGEYSKGLEVCSDNRRCLGTPHRIIRMALARVVVGKPYRFRYYSSRNISHESLINDADKLIDSGLSFLVDLFIKTLKQ